MDIAQKLKNDASHEVRAEASMELQRLRARLAAVESASRDRSESETIDRLRRATYLLHLCETGFSAFMFGRKMKRSERDKLRSEIAAFLDA